ncbi:hypothetical protein D027_1084, partial [Vibrio parahaemolyticus 861]
KVAANIRKDI